MSKKTEDKKVKSNFDINNALTNVNRYLKEGFMLYIENEKITSQKQFDKLYNEYKEFKV